MTKGTSTVSPAGPVARQGDKARAKKPKLDLDQNLENGPLANRGCTDIICCLIFLLFVGLCIYITATAFSKGNPWNLAQPYDLDGNPCGAVKSVTTDYKYAYFFNPTKGLNYVICLKSCPNWNLNSSTPTTLGACYLGANSSVETGMGKTGAQECNQNVVFLNISDPLVLYSTSIADQKNLKIYSTEPYFGRFCAPIALNEASKTFYDKVIKNTGAENKMDEYFSDLRNSYGIILISFGFAFMVSLFYMIILRWLTGFFVWTTILLFLGALLTLAILCHVKSNQLSSSAAAAADGQSNSSATSRTLYWFAVALYILFSVTLCMVCCYFKTIELCIAVLKSAALFVKAHFCIINVPVIFSMVLFGYLMFGMFVLLFLWSIGEYKKRDGLPFGQVQWDTNVRRLIYVHLYSVILNGCIILYYGQFIIVASASIWYFNQGGSEAAYPSPVKTATWWGVRYHMGSIVFAAFLLSFIIVVKLILMYIQYQAEKIASKSPTAKLIRCVLCLMQCLVSCFERAIKFISKTGLTMVAITGKHFCSSCRQGMYLILRHPLKFGLVGVLGEVFVFLGKIFVAVLTTMTGYVVVTSYSYYKENLYSPVIPCIFFFFIGIIVGSIFMAVYGLAADAIMCCYFVDKELFEKKERETARAPEPLKEFFRDNKTDSGSSDDDKKPAPAPPAEKK